MSIWQGSSPTSYNACNYYIRVLFVTVTIVMMIFMNEWGGGDGWIIGLL